MKKPKQRVTFQEQGHFMYKDTGARNGHIYSLNLTHCEAADLMTDIGQDVAVAPDPWVTRAERERHGSPGPDLLPLQKP